MIKMKQLLIFTTYMLYIIIPPIIIIYDYHFVHLLQLYGLIYTIGVVFSAWTLFMQIMRGRGSLHN